MSMTIAEIIALAKIASKNSSGGSTTVEYSGAVVKVDVTEGESIKLQADTTEMVKLVHCGKNFLQFPYINKTAGGLKIATNADGTITVNGTSTGIVYIDYASKAAPYYLPAGIYAVSTNINVENINFVLQSDTAIFYPDGVADAKTVVSATSASPKRAFELKEGGWIYGNFVIRTGVVCDNMTLQVQIERGKTPYSNDDSNFTAYEPPVRTQTDVMFPIAVSAMEGLNYLYTQTGDVLTAKMTAVAGVSKDTVKKMIEEAARFDADAWGLPVLHLTGDTSAMTKDNAVDLEYKYGDLIGTASVKWQGSSSLNYPKKNYTIKFDQAFEAKEGWTAQKKYCFKANFIDHSHARNVCSCKLWGQIVKNRANVPTELSSLVNGGAIDGFPCIIVLNGEFHGLFTWNIPKDGWMFGAPKAIVCADAHTDATKFKALATLNGDFEVEYAEDEDNTDWILQSLNTAIQAVMNSDGSDLDTVVGQYIDIPSAIDYYIHTVDESADDGTSKNYLLVTFDGVKWYFSAYDRDTVYGLYWNGKSFTSPKSSVVSFAGYANIHAMMNLIYTHKTAELKARAVALRNGIKSEANVAQVFSNFICGIPSQVLDEDARNWPTIPSTSASNLAQILNWYRLRRAYLDPLIDAL